MYFYERFTVIEIMRARKHPPILGPNILLSTLCSNTLNLC
jgi:hypothetical protein